MHYYTPIRGWARALVGALGVFMLYDLAMIAAHFLLLWIFYRIKHGLPVSPNLTHGTELFAGTLDKLDWPASLLLAGLFLAWFYRAHNNLPALNAPNLEHSPGWAVGSFFVPILNLYRPYQIMREIWKASDPATPLDMPYAWTEAPSTPLIGWWWGLWLGRSLVGRLGLSLVESAMTPDQYMTGIYWSLAAQGMILAATFLLIRLVLLIEQRQADRASLIRAHASA